MDEPLSRGYIIDRIFSFVESYYDDDTARSIFGKVPERTLAIRDDLKGATWYPRAHVVDIVRAIASVRPDQDTIFDDFVACGRHMSNEATNGYLRILLKILTPSLFAKKVSSFWQRDNKNSGAFDPNETKVSNGYMRLKMVGVKGYDHVAPISAGFCSFVLDAMGKKNVEAKQSGWSVEAPGPESYVIELTWS